MKKILPYILILIISAGFFGWGGKVKKAQADPLGNCVHVVVIDPSKTPPVTQTKTDTNTTKEWCDGTIGTNGKKPGSWTQTSKDPTPDPLPATPTVPVTALQQDGSFLTGEEPIYYLLEPLPCKEGTTGCFCEGNPKVCLLRTFDPTSKTEDGKIDSLGKYLNMLITLFIGVCAVLAVIMIVMGGVEYMTSELISSKEAGKERITNAIFGLLLALGSWTILNQINPSLLRSDLNIPEVTVEVELRNEAILSDSGPLPKTAPLCSEGIVKTQSGMFACKNIANNLDTMITNAKKAGINLSGGGYRTPEQQFALRTAHCGAGNENNPSAKCNPDTALPGQSNHNNGKAFDLRCDGALIETKDNKCFLWLKANAASSGLYNLPSEPWHWSVDGH